jgi:hypothetical protein
MSRFTSTLGSPEFGGRPTTYPKGGMRTGNNLDPTELTTGGTMYLISYAARPCGYAKA